MANDLRFTLELDGVQKTITSVSDANKVIRELTKNFVLAKESGKDLTATMTQLNKALEVKQNLLLVSKGAVQMQQNMQGAQTASANASMALLNLNYVIRDSPYFFNNFALGVLAVGNNINPLIDSFSRLRKEAGEKSISTFQLLKQALVGGAGISIAFSLVVTAIQSFVFWQSRAKAETEKTTQSLQSQRNELQKLTREQFQNAIALAEIQLSEAMPKGARRLVGAGGKTVLMGSNGEPITEGKAFEINQRLNLLRQEYNMLGDIDNIENRLAINKQKLKDLNAQNFANLVSQATTLEEARQIVLQWIKADERQLKIWEGKTKELKIQKGLEAGILKSRSRQVNFFGGATESDRRLRQPTYLRRRGGVEPSGSTTASERNRAFGFGGMVKDLGIDLEMGKIAAQELGNALSSAFEQGTIKLNEFIQSMIVAITKMMILKAITGFLTGGLGGGASAIQGVASVGGGGGMFMGNPGSFGYGYDATRFKNSANTIRVGGKITANKNQFIVQIENARDYYNANERLITIGRD